jgi:hypothetical protein
VCLTDLGNLELGDYASQGALEFQHRGIVLRKVRSLLNPSNSSAENLDETTAGLDPHAGVRCRILLTERRRLGFGKPVSVILIDSAPAISAE